ncbi:MAG: 16S rRNA (cytosine(1402)-N(4))-methyltransferase RsmH [Patescibacteria group bacterium]|nr:16S rRNA (cytosine(1402)-N(4))-methyltransferase RsmH [Patescibacteria group bacterium]
MAYQHTPVMLKEVMAYLQPRPGQNFIDCTLGGGGYSRAILKEIGASGKILAIDLDEMAINNFKLKISDSKISNVILVHDSFKNLGAIAGKYLHGSSFDGIVFDLGLSSAQLNDPERGFSFNLPAAPLGMNFGKPIELRAEEIINDYSVEELVEIFKNYGEEKFAHKIALAIARERQLSKIAATGQLVKIIVSAIPKRFHSAKIHPATKIFQALRIAVNRELESLAQALPQAADLLKPGGRIAVVSYHSLEDRIVKQYFKQESRDCLCPPAMPVCQCHHRAKLKILTRGVLRPAEKEILNNPRARSAKLRVAEKI